MQHGEGRSRGRQGRVRANVGSSSHGNRHRYLRLTARVSFASTSQTTAIQVHPNDIAIDGWDISSMNLADAMARARVLEPTLQQQVCSPL